MTVSYDFSRAEQRFSHARVKINPGDTRPVGAIQSQVFLEGPPLSRCFLEALFQMKYKINPSGVSGESSPGLEVNHY